MRKAVALVFVLLLSGAWMILVRPREGKPYRYAEGTMLLASGKPAVNRVFWTDEGQRIDTDGQGKFAMPSKNPYFEDFDRISVEIHSGGGDLPFLECAYGQIGTASIFFEDETGNRLPRERFEVRVGEYSRLKQRNRLELQDVPLPRLSGRLIVLPPDRNLKLLYFRQHVEGLHATITGVFGRKAKPFRKQRWMSSGGYAAYPQTTFWQWDEKWNHFLREASVSKTISGKIQLFPEEYDLASL